MKDYETIAIEMQRLTELIDLCKRSLMDAVERNDLKSVDYFCRLWESYQKRYQECLKKIGQKLIFRAT